MEKNIQNMSTKAKKRILKKNLVAYSFIAPNLSRAVHLGVMI